MQKCQHCLVYMEAHEPREVDTYNFKLISHIACAWKKEVDNLKIEACSLEELNIHFKGDV